MYVLWAFKYIVIDIILTFFKQLLQASTARTRTSASWPRAVATAWTGTAWMDLTASTARAVLAGRATGASRTWTSARCTRRTRRAKTAANASMWCENREYHKHTIYWTFVNGWNSANFLYGKIGKNYKIYFLSFSIFNH